MTALGELSIWIAAPFMLLSAIASLAGGWKGRRRLADMGGRSAEVASLLLLLAAVGLGYGLLTVELRYDYIARYSGFQQPWPWRIAALWSGPAGAALCVTFLFMATAAAGYRCQRSRGSAGRTGALSVLALFALLLVVRTAPFAAAVPPPASGAGLPLTVEQASWQVELVSVLLATTCAAFTFAGLLGSQLVESPGRERWERAAVLLAGCLLTVALAAASWRAYTSSGRLLGTSDLSTVAVHAPAWLLAVGHLHAPGGLAVPIWAIRWRRITGVALFPALLGDAASLLAAQGAPPPAIPWAGAVAVGVVSGAMAGMGRGHVWGGGTERVPGFGPYAALGGLGALALSGLIVGWGLLRIEVLGHAVWLCVLLALTGAVAWSAHRPAGRWRSVWPVALAAAVVGSIAVYVSGGVTLMALAAGLAMGLAVGLAADLTRIARARRELRRWRPEPDETGVMRSRSERRWASAVAHLGLALVVIGLAADALTRSETRSLQPGESLAAPAGSDLSVTYLGLSRYQVGELDREVASFRLRRGDGATKLITASSTFDWSLRRRFERSAVEPGAARDVIVTIAGRGGGEGIVCRFSVRPLASFVWLGGFLLVIAMLVRGRPGA